MATVRSYQPMRSVKLASGFLCPTRVLAVRSWIVSLADGFAFVFFQYVKDLQQLKSTLTAYCVRLHLAFRNFI